jgi:hypothetical protein
VSDDDLELPEFLRRHKGEVRAPWRPLPTAVQEQEQEKWRATEDERLAAKKVKARGRVAKMLARQRDRKAFADGLTWDTKHGRWI